MKYTPNHFDYDYLKGIVLSDGHINKNNGVRITTSSAGYSLLYKQRGYSVIERKQSKASFTGEVGTYYDIRIGNLAFAEDNLRLLEGKRYTNLEVSNPPMFLAGFLDGNGYVSSSRAEIELSVPSSRPEVVDSLVEHLDVLGVVPTGVYDSWGGRKARRVLLKNIEACRLFSQHVSPHVLMQHKHERLLSLL